MPVTTDTTANPVRITRDNTCPDTAADRNPGALGALAELLRGLIDKLLPPWYYPPASYQPFDYQNAVANPGAGNSATILTFKVPTGYNMVARRISVNYTGGGFTQGSGALIWTVRVDGSAVKNYAQILTELGTIQIPRPTDGILANSDQVVSITVSNVSQAGGGTFFVASLGGWFYPVPRKRIGGQ